MDATMSKHLQSQPVSQCPWTSKAPLTSVKSCTQNPPSTSAPLPSIPNANNTLPIMDNNVSNNDKLEMSGDLKSPLQHSSSQFFHFLRLMQLFPDVHPATLHSVMSLCKNDFFGAVDKLLFAKRCKNYYINQRTGPPPKNAHQQRYQPYGHSGKRQEDFQQAQQKQAVLSNDVACVLDAPISYVLSEASSASVVDLKRVDESNKNSETASPNVALLSVPETPTESVEKKSELA